MNPISSVYDDLAVAINSGADDVLVVVDIFIKENTAWDQCKVVEVSKPVQSPTCSDFASRRKVI